MTLNTSFRVTAMEVLILQHKAANQTQDPYESPVFQLRSLLKV